MRVRTKVHSPRWIKARRKTTNPCTSQGQIVNKIQGEEQSGALYQQTTVSTTESVERSPECITSQRFLQNRITETANIKWECLSAKHNWLLYIKHINAQSNTTEALCWLALYSCRLKLDWWYQKKTSEKKANHRSNESKSIKLTWLWRMGGALCLVCVHLLWHSWWCPTITLGWALNLTANITTFRLWLGGLWLRWCSRGCLRLSSCWLWFRFRHYWPAKPVCAANFLASAGFEWQY